VEATAKDVPEAAFSFSAGRVQFAAGETSDGKSPITILARSGKPINHWYWGQVVHDMAGMTLAGDRVMIDWLHTEEAMGYASKFDTTTGDLVVSGELVSFREDDRAAEVAFRGPKGVPYEASIFFDPYNGLRIEEVAPGVTTVVNGQQIVGPAVVFRQWLLRGVSVCPYGADPNSATMFARKTDNQITVTMFSAEGEAMSQNAATKTDPKAADTATPPSTPATQMAATPVTQPAIPATPADPRAQFAVELKRYTTAFGAENGSKWLAEGKNFEEACELHLAATNTQLAARDKEIGELKARLAAVNTGEPEPVSFSAAEKKEQPGATKSAESATKFAHLGTNLSKFAAGVKLPTK
jgi:hypothetical protein